MSRLSTRLPAFTLIELMIATVLGSMLLLTAGALFMTFMIGSANTNARRQMSAEGVQMIGALEFHIRNAKSATCTTPGGVQTLTLTKLDGTFAQGCFSNNKLNFSSTTASCGTNALNSDFVTLNTPPPSFTCTTAANGKQTVLIQFTLGTSEDASITAPFSTIVQLRNS